MPEDVITSVPVAATAPSATNPRTTIDEAALRELTDSVRRHGVLQPILVRPWPLARPWADASRGAPKGELYEIIAGERRWRAARAAGLTEIPARLQELTDEQVLEVQVIENLQRQDLHPLEEAEGYRELLARKHTTASIAERVGRSVPYVYDRLRLLDLVDEAKEVFRTGQITPGHAVVLSRLRPADQKRAMHPQDGGLWKPEHTLELPWNWDKGASRRSEPRKTASVRELQGWVDAHVRFAADAPDTLDLFPETAQAVKTAAEEAEKVVSITHEYHCPPEAKDGKRVYGPMSWRRADKKSCPSSVTGVIVIGPGRGEAIRVCVDKKGCKVHWAAEQREAKAREKRRLSGGGKAEDRWAEQQRREDERRKREDAERKRWEKARPAILEAIRQALKKASCSPAGPLGKLLLGSIDRYDNRDVSKAPTGKTADDLVRHIGLLVLASSCSAWSREPFLRQIKPFGVNVGNILDKVAPREKETPEAKCRKCGCTEAKACPGGCAWAEKPDAKTGLGLCTTCAKPAGKKKAAKGRA